MSEPIWIARNEAFSVGIIEASDDLDGFRTVVSVEGGQRTLSRDEAQEMDSALSEARHLQFWLWQLRDGLVEPRSPGVFIEPPAKDAPLAALIEWAQENDELHRKSTPMTINELELAANSLFGRNWVEPMARSIKLPTRELEKIAKGKQEMPDWMRGAVALVASQRIEAASTEVKKLAKWA